MSQEYLSNIFAFFINIQLSFLANYMYVFIIEQHILIMLYSFVL